MIETVTTVRELRSALLAWREKGESVALVPTMGALHKGHMALVDSAKRVAEKVVVSIFVNPTQFGPKEDLSRYPRKPDEDRALLAAHGCDLVYMPEPGEIYPGGFVTSIDPGPMATLFEGAIRPGHFAGVATIVTKLLLQVLPDIAFFGEKDYQQLLIIRRTVQDLDLPVHIASVPIVRDTDGLALSSRNAYLSPEDRKAAAVLPQILIHVAKDLHAGANPKDMLEGGKKTLTEAGFTVDYLELTDANTLHPIEALGLYNRLLVAARIGGTRLIDNMAIDRTKELK